VAEKIVVNNLYKIYGKQPQRAMAMLDKGESAASVLAQTGMAVGVENASFHVNEGEIFVLMGLSGSGKSTLIRLLNRLIEPTQGQIRIDGKDVTAMDAGALRALRRSDLAMVFQSFALLPHLSVLENAALGLEVAGMAKKPRLHRAMQVLEQVGLQTFAQKKPAELSGGMQQRVGLARALAVNPSLMLMDEAFSALDPLKRAEMQDLLLQLQKEQQRTIVFVSHDLDEAFHLGDRIGIMHAGRIVQIGTPAEILRNPSDAYVRAFFKGVDVKKHMLAQDIAALSAVCLVRPDAQGYPSLAATLAELGACQQQYAFVLDADARLLGCVSQDSLRQALQAGQPSHQAALLGNLCVLRHDTTLSEVIAHSVRQPLPLAVVGAQQTYSGAITPTLLLQQMHPQERDHG
jgi:glycine betaine/proline transport system ATP-binding protein